MKVFNLSDATPPYKPERRARTLKIVGVLIEPGESGEVPDTVPTSEFSGLLVSNMVSIDTVPDWYGSAKLEAEKRKKEEALASALAEEESEAEVQEQPVEEPEPEEQPEPAENSKRSRKRRKKS